MGWEEVGVYSQNLSDEIVTYIDAGWSSNVTHIRSIIRLNIYTYQQVYAGLDTPVNMTWRFVCIITLQIVNSHCLYFVTSVYYTIDLAHNNVLKYGRTYFVFSTRLMVKKNYVCMKIQLHVGQMFWRKSY